MDPDVTSLIINCDPIVDVPKSTILLTALLEKEPVKVGLTLNAVCVCDEVVLVNVGDIDNP
jgi:hypothetical protein